MHVLYTCNACLSIHYKHIYNYVALISDDAPIIGSVIGNSHYWELLLLKVILEMFITLVWNDQQSFYLQHFHLSHSLFSVCQSIASLFSYSITL